MCGGSVHRPIIQAHITSLWSSYARMHACMHALALTSVLNYYIPYSYAMLCYAMKLRCCGISRIKQLSSFSDECSARPLLVFGPPRRRSRAAVVLALVLVLVPHFLPPQATPWPVLVPSFGTHRPSVGRS